MDEIINRIVALSNQLKSNDREILDDAFISQTKAELMKEQSSLQIAIQNLGHDNSKMQHISSSDSSHTCFVDAPNIVELVEMRLAFIKDREIRHNIAIEYVIQSCIQHDDLSLPAPECFRRRSVSTTEAAANLLRILSQ